MANLDKLDALLAAHGANGVKTPEDTVVVADDAPMVAANDEPISNEPITTSVQVDPIDDDINYGDDDADNEYEAQRQREEAEREAQYSEMKANEVKSGFMPPDEKNEAYNREAVGFQTEKLAMVSAMVNRVIAKYHLIEGGIPEVYESQDGKIHWERMNIMGELIDIYHTTGEVITPEFENMVLSHWLLPDGTFANNVIAAGGKVGDHSTTQTEENQTAVAPVDDPMHIDINVQGDTPVTVNIDETFAKTVGESKEIEVLVKRTTTFEMDAAEIVNNSPEAGVIKPYNSGINDQPITLPRSAYRAVATAINWFDFIKLTSAPTSGNIADAELRKWSIIYKHIKNVSIGEFTDFNDFLKKTKYADRELLMWAILVATSDPEEDISLICGNPDCGEPGPEGEIIKQPNTFKYQPAKLIHFDENLLPDYYNDIHKASVGPEAIDLWNSAACKLRLYKLPETGIIVELEDPSVYDYIYSKIPITTALYERYRPNSQLNSESNLEGDDLIEFQLLLQMALSISAVYVTGEDGKTYKYTKWEKIEEVITKMLSNSDSGTLIKLVQVIAEQNECFAFYLEDIRCPKCGRLDKRVPIKDISETLLSQLSLRLSNINIKLTDMQ